MLILDRILRPFLRLDKMFHLSPTPSLLFLSFLLCPMQIISTNSLISHGGGGCGIRTDRRRYPPGEWAVDCGWLATQFDDFYPHYAPADSQGALVKAGATNGSPFKGYANSHRVLGTSFYREILDEYTTL
ncbi:MAG: hypothetical protein ACYC9Q_14850, partial [Bacillota bacterium]